MYDDWIVNLAVVAATALAVGACVLLHYEGLVLWLLLLSPAFGTLGPAVAHLFDFVYFSAVTFTTVGFGDLVPSGAVRFFSGTEALTGFVLIAWSASFTYLEMERFWRGP